MRGKVVGVSLKKCSAEKKWDTACTLCLQVDAPKVGKDVLVSEGSFFRPFTMNGDLLPCKPNDIIGKTVAISSNNGFVDDVFLLS